MGHLLDIAKECWENIPAVEGVDDAARKYAAGMHNNPFSYYNQRAAALNIKGRRMLDAGCGAGTWAFAFSPFFERIDGCDINEPRVVLANQLADQFNIGNTHFRRGSVLDLPYEDAAFSFVFCYSVLISSIPMEEVLREYARVLEPGGKLYICLNGIGWSMYLRDTRGATDEATRIKGLRGLYNTIVNGRFGFTPAYVRSRWQNISSASPIVKARNIDQVENGPDAVFSVLHDPTIYEIAEAITRECGTDYRAKFADDLIRVGTGHRDAFSEQKAGRGYEPEFIGSILGYVGFQDFRWAPEGRLNPMPEHLIRRDKSHNGFLKNWELLATR